MKRKVIAAGAAAVVMVGGGAWMGLGPATATPTQPSIHGWPSSTVSATKTIATVKADAAQSGSQVLLLREHDVRVVSVDVNNDGFGPGDYFISESQLRYLHGADVVGRSTDRCTLGPRSFICDATALLFGKGKIVVYGATFPPNAVRLAVTGGTGLYQGVGGQLDVAALPHGSSLLAFEIKR